MIGGGRLHDRRGRASGRPSKARRRGRRRRRRRARRGSPGPRCRARRPAGRGGARRDGGWPSRRAPSMGGSSRVPPSGGGGGGGGCAAARPRIGGRPADVLRTRAARGGRPSARGRGSRGGRASLTGQVVPGDREDRVRPRLGPARISRESAVHGPVRAAGPDVGQLVGQVVGHARALGRARSSACAGPPGGRAPPRRARRGRRPPRARPAAPPSSRTRSQSSSATRLGPVATGRLTPRAAGTGRRRRGSGRPRRRRRRTRAAPPAAAALARRARASPGAPSRPRSGTDGSRRCGWLSAVAAAAPSAPPLGCAGAGGGGGAGGAGAARRPPRRRRAAPLLADARRPRARAGAAAASAARSRRGATAAPWAAWRRPRRAPRGGRPGSRGRARRGSRAAGPTRRRAPAARPGEAQVLAAGGDVARAEHHQQAGGLAQAQRRAGRRGARDPAGGSPAARSHRPISASSPPLRDEVVRLPGGDPRDLLVAARAGAVGEHPRHVPRPARRPDRGLVERRPAAAAVARAPELLERGEALPAVGLVGVPPQRAQPLAGGHPQAVEHAARARRRAARGAGPAAPAGPWPRRARAAGRAPSCRRRATRPLSAHHGTAAERIDAGGDPLDQLLDGHVGARGLDPLLHQVHRQQGGVGLAPAAVGQPGGDQPRRGGRVDQLGRVALAVGQQARPPWPACRARPPSGGPATRPSGLYQPSPKTSWLVWTPIGSPAGRNSTDTASLSGAGRITRPRRCTKTRSEVVGARCITTAARVSSQPSVSRSALQRTSMRSEREVEEHPLQLARRGLARHRGGAHPALGELLGQRVGLGDGRRVGDAGQLEGLEVLHPDVGAGAVPAGPVEGAAEAGLVEVAAHPGDVGEVEGALDAQRAQRAEDAALDGRHPVEGRGDRAEDLLDVPGRGGAGGGEADDDRVARPGRAACASGRRAWRGPRRRSGA